MESEAVSQSVSRAAAEGVLLDRSVFADLSTFRYLKRRLLNIVVLAGGDALALLAGGWLSSMLYAMWKGQYALPDWWWLLIVSWWGGSAAMNMLPGWGLGAVEELRRYALLIAGLFALLTVVLFVAKAGADVSRLLMTSSVGFSAPLLLLSRRVGKQLLIRWGRWGLPTVVYGHSSTARRTLQALLEDQGLGLVPIGIFCGNGETPPDHIQGVPVLGRLRESTHLAPAAVVALDDLSRREVIELLEGTLARYRRVVLVPDLLEAPSLWVTPRDIGGILGLEVSHNLLDPLAQFCKRGTDLLLILGAAPLWAPLIAALSLWIWLEDRRPPFFTQERVGRNHQVFRTLKFRTMVVHAEQVLQQALARDPALRQEWETHFKLRRDPRVTRIGGLLRRTSLDELPQLINVLLGHMSLVGPRPLPRYHEERLPDALRQLRRRVRPGITGMWQVSGRSEIGNAGMLRWDSYYVRNWSIWLDVVILVRTVRVVLQGGGAY